jgi:histidine triad (HIT) family protein
LIFGSRHPFGERVNLSFSLCVLCGKIFFLYFEMEGGAMSESCLFCRIAGGGIPAKKVYEDEEVVVIEDISPVAPVHLLAIPKKHIVNCLGLRPEDDGLIGRVHRIAAEIARDRGIADGGFRVVTNNNAGAGQSVFHIHFHIIGGRSLQWPPG